MLKRRNRRNNHLNYILREVDKLVQEYEDRTSVFQIGFIESYLKAKFSVHVHVRFLQGNIENESLCARFEPRGIDGNGKRLDNIDGSIGAFLYHSQGGERQNRMGQGKQLMLVPSVQLMEPIETVGRIPIPITVRLELLNDSPCIFRKSVWYSPFHGILKLGLDPVNGKSRPPVGSSPCNQFQLVSHVIQRGPEVVYNIPDNYRPCERGLVGNPNLRDVLFKFRVILEHDTLRIFPLESFNEQFQLTDMLFGPLNLGPASVKGMSHW